MGGSRFCSHETHQARLQQQYEIALKLLLPTLYVYEAQYVVFFTQIFPKKVIDMSALSPYDRGSF